LPCFLSAACLNRSDPILQIKREKMDQNFDLRSYVIRGAERVAAEVMRATWKNPRESAFMLRFGAAFAAAAKRRKDARGRGKRAPGYLTLRLSAVEEPTDWEAFFAALSKRGVSVILLTGAEALHRPALLETAGKTPDICFPVFTSALPGAQELKLLDRCRNLVPVVNVSETGGQTLETMDALGKKNILFGAFAAVTGESLNAVCADARVNAIAKRGCKGLLYLDELASEAEKASLAAQISRLRIVFPEMLFFSMDAKHFGGTILHGSKAELDKFLQ